MDDHRNRPNTRNLIKKANHPDQPTNLDRQTVDCVIYHHPQCISGNFHEDLYARYLLEKSNSTPPDKPNDR